MKTRSPRPPRRRSEPVTRRNRRTWSFITVGRAADLDLCEEGGPWVTLCETHHEVTNHETRRDAEGWGSHPDQWCEGCRELLSRKRGSS